MNTMTDEYREQLAYTFEIARERSFVKGWAFGFFTGMCLMVIFVSFLTSV